MKNNKDKVEPLIRLDVNDSDGKWMDCTYFIGEESVTQRHAMDYAMMTDQVDQLHDQEKDLIKRWYG